METGGLLKIGGTVNFSQINLYQKLRLLIVQKNIGWRKT